jgi:rod shape determining protein RodA|tara:strand:- start:668 stop:862 length:195 start_codon:yes stop_codon:yes gene_type:complete
MLLGLGIISTLFFYVVFNLGMTIGLFPVVGIPLPLVSYGGSSIVSTYIAIGIILNIGMRRSFIE